MNLEDICRALGVDVLPGAGAVMVTGAGMDSRAMRCGDLFVCIAGDRVDGHEYAAEAVSAGAVAVLAAQPVHVDAPVILVPDTVKALGRLAHTWRARFLGKVVAVTGSAGKTTVKEILAQVLAVHGVTARNVMNLNNQIGMPFSVLATTGEEDFWVMEAGISQEHDMDELAAVLEPDLALVINVGGAHADGLSGRGIAWHKARLLAYVRPGGVSLVSADYPDLWREARAAFPGTLFFSSEGRPLAYRGTYSGPAALGEGRGMYRLWLDGHTLDVEAPFRGRYGAENTIAVAAAARVLGLTGMEIAQGFSSVVLPKQRFQVRHAGGRKVIDDTYNANPLSMTRMLDAAVELAEGIPLYAVLGAMGELGPTARVEHEKLGCQLVRSHVRAVFWRGPHLEDVRAGIQTEGGLCPVYAVDSAEQFTALWTAHVPHCCVVLCKGSRFTKIEELVHVITAHEEVPHVL